MLQEGMDLKGIFGYCCSLFYSKLFGQCLAHIWSSKYIDWIAGYNYLPFYSPSPIHAWTAAGLRGGRLRNLSRKWNVRVITGGNHRNWRRSSSGCTNPKKMPEFLSWLGSVHEAFRESSTELGTMLGLGSLGTVCRAYFCPLIYWEANKQGKAR